MRRLVHLVQLWLGSLFLYSGALKLVNYAQAKRLLEPYRLFPKRVNEAVGLALPWTELVAGVSFLTGRFYPLGPMVTSVLGGCFVYVARDVLKREATVPCGCTGSDGSNVNRTTFWRGVAVLAGSLALLALGRRNYGRPSVPTLLVSLTLSLLPPLFAVRNNQQRREHLRQRSARRAKELASLTATLAYLPEVPTEPIKAESQPIVFLDPTEAQ